LLQYFKHSDLQKLERLGGRILVSLTSPYANRRRKDKKAIKVDDRFVKKLEALKASPEKIHAILNELTVKELRKLADLVGQPIRSNASGGEVRSELVRYIRAEEFWHRISGTERRGS